MATKHARCPRCGHEFDPDSPRSELEHAIREKMDHSCYDNASYRWMGSRNMYVYLPREGPCNTSVSEEELPDEWMISAVWSEKDRTVVSIGRSDG